MALTRGGKTLARARKISRNSKDADDDKNKRKRVHFEDEDDYEEGSEPEESKHGE